MRNFQPKAEVVGILVQEMAPQSTEVIVGAIKDKQFGQTIMFGLGGIYVELLADLAFRIGPISHSEALAMIHETKAGRMLAGLRGREAADVAAVVDCLIHLNQLAYDFPQIEEIEINPLLVLAEGQGVIALDGRIILSSNKKNGNR